jgi:hypothetical protein
LPNRNKLPTAGISAESSEEIFPCRTEFVTKFGPQISLLPVPIFGVNKSTMAASDGRPYSPPRHLDMVPEISVCRDSGCPCGGGEA